MLPSSGKLLCQPFKIRGNKSAITQDSPYLVAAKIWAVALGGSLVFRREDGNI
jgi:hypothetical protein